MKTKSKAKTAKTETKSSVARRVAGEQVSDGPPPAFVLLQLAEAEPDQTELREYFDVIKTLRSKHFSFREIADWLTEKGIEADYNAVYRVFTKYMDPQDEAEEAEREHDEAEDEAKRD
jgi:hypothetical protein